MNFRLVPKSVTLNDLERRNGRYFALFQRIPVALRKSSRSLSPLLTSSCVITCCRCESVCCCTMWHFWIDFLTSLD